MELDQPKLQLIINVVAITTGTTLAMIWRLRQQDRQALTNRLSQSKRPAAAAQRSSFPQSAPGESMAEQSGVAQSAAVQPVAELSAPEQVSPEQGSPEQGASVPQGPVALPSMRPDIREFVTHRAQTWSAPSVAQWNQRLSGSTKPEAALGMQNAHPAPHSMRVVFPRQEPKPVGLQGLAAPLQLCRSFAALKYGS